jgi:hypothetical protein
MTKTIESTATKYHGLPSLLRKNYWINQDGGRARGI